MYLLDTNICIALLKGNPQVISSFNACADECYISTINVAELYKGVYCSRRVEQNLVSLELFLKDMPIISFDLFAAKEFGKIQSELRQIGKPTGELDAMIAAVARSRHDWVVTNNTKDFINISGLGLENWII
ncbi:type II toxin-antitoxin system VapC family toxin [Pseudanabaena sp. ABRG5-3]|uniref:type II toxin-antitoxin system VapC family toxin n=1 Tax=Pseudanabaena sp. ABRG5-3 TaxID=685565 RepID=UPI000DC70170|nr:type II toxin-antitoxin system VapC family toxin [Pseudanabaena sp. ABRG5-3]BBC26022.1 PilT protein domain protein [Pseudanabaena sp. ABRG5-3]